MAEYRASSDLKRCPVHPGAVLTDALEDVAESKVQIAQMLGVSRQYLHAVLTGRKPLSPAMAVRVAKAFGGSAEMWLRMQANHDAWHARQEIDVSNIPTLKAA